MKVARNIERRSRRWRSIRETYLGFHLKWRSGLSKIWWLFCWRWFLGRWWSDLWCKGYTK